MKQHDVAQWALMSSNQNSIPSCLQEEADSAKIAEFDKVLYHITHDVRAALRAIQTLPDWIKEDLEKCRDAVPASVFEDLEMLKAQTERADRILIDLRTYNRIGRKSDASSWVSLQEALDEAVARLSSSSELAIESHLEAKQVFAPRNDIVTFFEALVSNAVKHHPMDTAQILVHSLEGPKGTTITVEDNGPGIEEEFHDRVFELMTTLRPRDECEGSGVGLSIVRRIAENLGGYARIEAPRHLGGTCVTALFPRAKAPTPIG